MALRKATDRNSISTHDRPSPALPCKHPTISHHSGHRLSIDVYTACSDQFTSETRRHPSAQLYTPEERRRRDASPWTIVQGVLAPVQFAVFLISLVLVMRYLATGDGFAAATVSIVIKTFVLYAIMITGSDLGARGLRPLPVRPPFFWEDVFSMLVLALHTAYLAGLGDRCLAPQQQMLLALAAYATYVINAAQFLIKLRAARREQPATPVGSLELAMNALARTCAVTADVTGAVCAARARSARGVLRSDRHHLAAPQDPGRVLPGGRLAHLRAPDPVGRRRHDLRRAAIRDRHHRRARPRRPLRRQRRTRSRRRGASGAASRHPAPVPGRLLPVRGDQARPVACRAASREARAAGAGAELFRQRHRDHLHAG